MAQTIAIASGKGGAGKSTVTANLGALLSRDGFRTLIIDADIGLRAQDALLGLENRVVYDLVDLIDGGCLPEEALLPCESWPGLFLLPAAQFSRAKAIDAKRFRRLLTPLRAGFDFVLIDCPAGLERGLRNVLGAGIDEILLVTAPDDLSLRCAERVRQLADEKGLERPRLIVNRIDPGLVRGHIMISAATASQVIDLPLLGEIPDDPAVGLALLKHTLPVLYDCEARRAFQRIASRLEGKETPFPDYGTEKEPFYRRLFRTGRLREVTPLDDH